MLEIKHTHVYIENRAISIYLKVTIIGLIYRIWKYSFYHSYRELQGTDIPRVGGGGGDDI